MNDKTFLKNFKKFGSDSKKHLLTGVSYAIPFIAAGGILIALALTVYITRLGNDVSSWLTTAIESNQAAIDAGQSPEFNIGFVRLWMTLFNIGEVSFSLMYPVLAGYIAYAIAGRPALVPGFIGGFLANNLQTAVYPEKITSFFENGVPESLSTGFLGALFIGWVAGWLVFWMKKLPVHRTIRPVMPILIIPILSSILIGLLMIWVIGIPLVMLNSWLSVALKSLGDGNRIWLGLLLGAMIAFDMGGPVNKAAFFFGAGMIESGNIEIMGAVGAAICVPPLGLAIATFIMPKLWSDAEKRSGYAAFFMGLIGITEGAIPFAASDPIRIIPSIMAGSMTAGMISMLFGAGNHAPHGGLIVLPVVSHRLVYVIAIVSGIMVTVLLVTLLKWLKYRKMSKED